MGVLVVLSQQPQLQPESQGHSTGQNSEQMGMIAREGTALAASRTIRSASRRTTFFMGSPPSVKNLRGVYSLEAVLGMRGRPRRAAPTSWLSRLRESSA